jgi:uncharacterized repeat protein (TIGR03803 family)
MRKIAFRAIAFVVAVFCVATAVVSHAQTYNVLFGFSGADGYGGQGISLTQGTDGNLYGTTLIGGRNYTNDAGGGYGTAFKITPTGRFTSLYQFCLQSECADGSGPGGLTLGVNGNFYGSTYAGGTGTGSLPGCGPGSCGGTFFEMTPAGKLTTLYTFCSQAECADGSNPSGVQGPVLGINGHYYGTAYQGGSSICYDGCGTVYDITTSGAQTTLYDLCTQVSCTFNEAGPIGLILGNNGRFYGMQLDDGEPTLPGLLFEVTSQGKDGTLHTFPYDNRGFLRPAVLVQGSDGDLYGATTGGVNGAGTLFKIGASGGFTTLYTFCSQTDCADGYQPNSLIQGSDGNLYGTTVWGGNQNPACDPYVTCGTIFKLTPSGEYSVLYSFCSQANCADGFFPGGLMQATDGTFYGGTATGVTLGTCYLNKGCGGIFSFSVGLRPFVTANPNFGKTGSSVAILGNNLTGTTSVTFNGTSSSFAVISPTLIKATVPAGATKGKVEVTTPSGTLKSNLVFQVLP